MSEISKSVDSVVVELARQNLGRVNSATTIQTPLVLLSGFWNA